MGISELLLFVAVAYGIGFWLQNKVDFLRGKFELVDKGLDCTFCTGFHAGWISSLLVFVLSLTAWKLNWLLVPKAIAFGFAAAASNYIIDTVVRYLESRIEPPPEE